jgi:hypothetical protein
MKPIDNKIFKSRFVRLVQYIFVSKKVTAIVVGSLLLTTIASIFIVSSVLNNSSKAQSASKNTSTTTPPVGSGSASSNNQTTTNAQSSKTSSSSLKAKPFGFFALPGKTSSLTTRASLLGNSFIDGIVIPVGWADIEPSKGVYDFSSIDSTLQLATNANKAATIVVFTGKNSYPSWLGSSGVTFWTDQKGSTLIDPSSTAFAPLWDQTIAELGKHYDSNATVRQVSMCGLTGTLCGPRFPEFPPNTTFDTLQSNWQSVINNYATAFPHTFLNLEVQSTQSHNADLPKNLFASLPNSNIGPFADYLSTNTPSLTLPSGQVFSQVKTDWCGFQMVSPLGSSVGNAIAYGHTKFGCTYYEIYEGDVTNYGNLIAPLHSNL